MSLSKPRFTGQKNPAKRFFEWGSTMESFFEYNKDTKQKEKVDLGKGFIILDKDLFSVSGYNEPKNEMIQSNVVRTVDCELIVKGYKDKKATEKLRGTYKELKERFSESNVYKYTKNIYISFEGELCHLKLIASGFSAWLEYVEKGNCDGKIISYTGFEQKRNGSNDYNAPVFSVGRALTQDEMDDAIQLDRQLQEYLDLYLANNGQKEEEPDYENESQEVKEFDSSKWREFTYRGEKLGNYEPYQLFEAQDALERNNDCDSAEYNCVTHAIKDYQHAQKAWTSKKDKSGKLLKDYTISELQEQLKKIPGTHEVKLILHAAIEHKLAEQGPNDPSGNEWDEEPIPF